MMAKKTYRQPLMRTIAIQPLAFIAVSVKVEDSSHEGPGWSDDETYDDALSRRRDEFGGYEW